MKSTLVGDVSVIRCVSPVLLGPQNIPSSGFDRLLAIPPLISTIFNKWPQQSFRLTIVTAVITVGLFNLIINQGFISHLERKNPDSFSEPPSHASCGPYNSLLSRYVNEDQALVAVASTLENDIEK